MQLLVFAGMALERLTTEAQIGGNDLRLMVGYASLLDALMSKVAVVEQRQDDEEELHREGESRRGEGGGLLCGDCRMEWGGFFWRSFQLSYPFWLRSLGLVPCSSIRMTIPMTIIVRAKACVFLLSPFPLPRIRIFGSFPLDMTDF